MKSSSSFFFAICSWCRRFFSSSVVRSYSCMSWTRRVFMLSFCLVWGLRVWLGFFKCDAASLIRLLWKVLFLWFFGFRTESGDSSVRLPAMEFKEAFFIKSGIDGSRLFPSFYTSSSSVCLKEIGFRRAMVSLPNPPVLPRLCWLRFKFSSFWRAVLSPKGKERERFWPITEQANEGIWSGPPWLAWLISTGEVRIDVLATTAIRKRVSYHLCQNNQEAKLRIAFVCFSQRFSFEFL